MLLYQQDNLTLDHSATEVNIRYLIRPTASQTELEAPGFETETSGPEVSKSDHYTTEAEMAVTLGKTPVSVLQELLSRRGTTPKYELVQIEGAIHEPTFRYRVTVSDVVAMGTGRSKKEAKHAAAKAILDKMIVSSQEEGGGIIGSTNNIPDVKSEIVSPYDDKIPGNPIGMLQEICMSRRWPPPSYDLTSEEGLPHERLFTIQCTVFKQKETAHHHQPSHSQPTPVGANWSDSAPSLLVLAPSLLSAPDLVSAGWKDDVMLVRMAGTGKSKKLAKRQAANKMWEKLQDAQNVSSSVSPGLEDDDEISNSVPNVAARYADLKDSKISTLSTNHSHKVSQFHKNLKGSSGPKLSDLQTTTLNNLDFNFVQFLNEIASEQLFEVTYVDIEEKSINGKAQCLVQLSTLPVAVCYGCGISSKEAQSSAAQNALEYLKIMTKK
uniref:DRBM domain-containing protein n=1 Tax=Timema shepardi TaxID=629360 RepID=A0A7R9G2D0_TIMSH|nr:unnamed protein product [Timema shepardi]